MIELQNICKSYKVARRSAGLGKAVKSLFRREYTRVDALSDVSFTVRDGEMVGYIGPNGAGKSSTIKIMSGVLTPDSGTCVINGACRGRSGRRMCRRSVWCSDSARSFGGTCPSPTASSCCATSTASTAPPIEKPSRV